MGQNEVSVKTNLYSSYVATKKGGAREVRRSRKVDRCGRFAADDSQVRQAPRQQCGAAQRLSALQNNRLAVRSAVRSIRPLLFAVG